MGGCVEPNHSYDCKKAWPSINRSIFSGAPFRTAKSVPTLLRGGRVEKKASLWKGGVGGLDVGVG